mmetsp:Transcript_3842/g.9675  ORF Transcript_3842/g.9675 Transcript_3842/m.9675 type:complete len:225 (+) Transcript_3842:48-722(+)
MPSCAAQRCRTHLSTSLRRSRPSLAPLLLPLQQLPTRAQHRPWHRHRASRRASTSGAKAWNPRPSAHLMTLPCPIPRPSSPRRSPQPRITPPSAGPSSSATPLPRTYNPLDQRDAEAAWPHEHRPPASSGAEKGGRAAGRAQSIMQATSSSLTRRGRTCTRRAGAAPTTPQRQRRCGGLSRHPLGAAGGPARLALMSHGPSPPIQTRCTAAATFRHLGLRLVEA